MRTKIVAAVILNADKTQLFITQRPKQKHKGGYWEFPGGKVEEGESSEQALARELQEEIAIEISEFHHLQSLEYDYPEKQLAFDFYCVTDFSGTAFGQEGQLGRWIAIEDIEQYEFPEANQAIVKRVVKRVFSGAL